MGQKGNLTTIRKKTGFKLAVENSKSWLSLYYVIENINRLFLVKGGWILNSLFVFDTNLVTITIFLYYQSFKIAFFKKKILNSLKKKIRKKLSPSQVKLDNKSLKNIFKDYSKRCGYNCFELRVLNLNKLVCKKKLVSLYKDLKIFAFNIFNRRYNLFIDFLKVSVLFFDNLIYLAGYIKVLGRVFKHLHKRLHGKFFVFVKTCINSLFKLKSLNGISQTQTSFAGMKFVLGGRIRGKQRSSSTKIRMGRIPTQTIREQVDFEASHVYTLYGVFGIKMWAFFEKK